MSYEPKDKMIEGTEDSLRDRRMRISRECSMEIVRPFDPDLLRHVATGAVAQMRNAAKKAKNGHTRTDAVTSMADATGPKSW